MACYELQVCRTVAAICIYIYIERERERDTHFFFCPPPSELPPLLPTMLCTWPPATNYIYIHIHMYVYMCMYMYVCLCVCVCVSMCLCVCIYIYIYTYTHVCTYIYIYIYTYIHMMRERERDTHKLHTVPICSSTHVLQRVLGMGRGMNVAAQFKVVLLPLAARHSLSSFCLLRGSPNWFPLPRSALTVRRAQLCLTISPKAATTDIPYVSGKHRSDVSAKCP